MVRRSDNSACAPMAPRPPQHDRRSSHKHGADDAKSSLIDFPSIVFVIGFLLVGMALSMLVPATVDYFADNADWQNFIFSAFITAGVGGGLIISTRRSAIHIDRREGFVITSTAWIVLGLFGSLPFHFSIFHLDMTDAIFEAVSGLTTTGSTVIVGLDTAPPGLLLWRSMLQWLGGIGIVVMAIAVLPVLKVGGMQLFKTESAAEKIVPRTGQLAVDLLLLYATLTSLCFIALRLAGMGTFDAVNHAMTTLSTGGFSTHDASVAYFNSRTIEWILVVFMIAGALPLARYISSTHRAVGAIWTDEQVRGFVLTLGALIAGLTLWLCVHLDAPVGSALIASAFSLTSVITTTGFTSGDYTNWGPPMNALFFVVTLIGGCSGSTAGALKIFRLQVLWIALHGQIIRLIWPSQIQLMRYNNRVLTEQDLLSVTSFLFAFLGILVAVALLLGISGLDPLTSVSAAATALANVGPGLGPMVGPIGNFADVENPGKWMLIAAMLLGRLEFFTFLVLLQRRFWTD